MMQESSDEQEIVFDVEHTGPLSHTPTTRTAPSTPLHPLEEFQPLADNSIAALKAARHLESFLSEEDATPVSYTPPQSHVSTPAAITTLDPYASPHRHVADASLLDVDDEDAQEPLNPPTRNTMDIPGAAGFLEMEEPHTPRWRPHTTTHGRYDPIATSSGLLLTHRGPVTSKSRFSRLEVEGGLGTASKHRIRHSPYTASNHSSYPFLPSLRSLTFPVLRYVQWGVVLSALVLLTGTAVVVQHAWSSSSSSSSSTSGPNDRNDQSAVVTRDTHLDPTNGNDQMAQLDLIPLSEDGDFPDRIILIPLPERDTSAATTTAHIRASRGHRRLELALPDNDPNRLVGVPAFDVSPVVPSVEPRLSRHGPLPVWHDPLTALRDEFHTWMQRHNKTYDSDQEHQYRFGIWSDNHHQTMAKNERHGPCRWTGKAVFGSTHFQDLTSDEFQSQYLNGYHLQRKPTHRQEPHRGAKQQPVVLDPNRVPPKRHPEVHERWLQEQQGQSYTLNYRAGCKWYDVSCHLRYIFSTYLYGMGGTMEPRYDADSYPTAVDWRSMGAVTEVHSQGSCGACWAITAVETVESAYFIAKGTLYDLAETEVIVCAGCELCAGGWPQDALDYIINNKGLPLESVMPYSADYLLMVSDQVAGTSDELDADTVKAYQQATCPSGGNGNNGGGHSGDGEVVSGSNSYSRYGKIKGYGYSTAKCVCYTDGSGCDCDKQNEGYAVRNVATYGPAVVCLDASTWQDYTEGIITSDSGCSSGFMDVNHCVQAVGYAYLAEGEEAGEGTGDKDSNSRSGSGSKDSSQRQGYWIVRNQWSKYWGMNGYAYVAMGDNTCGILNDMLQAYT